LLSKFLNTGRLTILLATLFVACLAISCQDKITTSAKDTFKYWTGYSAPQGFDLIKGKYWQSSHWTKEYIIYLKFKPTKQWWDEFIRQSNLSPDSSIWEKPTDAPAWFKPTDNSIQYGQSGFSQGSRYFRDSITGVCYVYEIQL
jgi:hypothetical protein